LSTYRDIDGTIHLGDIVVEVAGRGVTGSSDIPRALDGKKAGEEITVVVVRRNQKVPLKVRLQAAPR
jgi:S1-C subfamily serine protease